MPCGFLGAMVFRAERRLQTSGTAACLAVFKDSQEAGTCAQHSREGQRPQTDGGLGGTGGGLLGQCKSLGVGSIFKGQSHWRIFGAEMNSCLSFKFAHDCLLRRVCFGGREGQGKLKTRVQPGTR